MTIQVNFKFQSDSINTTYDEVKNLEGFGFKFQSDSINTKIEEWFEKHGILL